MYNLVYKFDPKLRVDKRVGKMACNGQNLLLCWYFLMSSPEPLPPDSYRDEKLKLKITTKADSNPSAGFGLIAI